MTVNVPAISWQPYNNVTIIAAQNCDFAVDTSYVIPTKGQYSSNVASAGGVIINNLANNGFVTVIAGPLTESIAPFTRSYLQLDPSIGNITVKGSVGVVILTLFKGQYPGNNGGTNYAGAASLASLNAFSGVATTGSANAQVLTAVTPTGYTITQGVLITATAGFTNTGDWTLAIAGTTPLHVHKITAAGSVACTGGEVEANANFTVSTNNLTGVYELVGAAGLGSISSAANSGIDIGGTPSAATVTLNVSNLTQTNPAQSTAVPFSNGGGAATSHTAFAGNASSLVAAGGATKAQMVAAADNSVIVTPAHITDALGVAKAWAAVQGTTGGIQDSFGVASVMRNSTGNYTIAWTVAFATAFYAVAGSVIENAHQAVMFDIVNGGRSTGSVVIQLYIAGSTTPVDQDFSIIAFGRQ